VRPLHLGFSGWQVQIELSISEHSIVTSLPARAAVSGNGFKAGLRVLEPRRRLQESFWSGKTSSDTNRITNTFVWLKRSAYY
jgi:hypothetical protein